MSKRNETVNRIYQGTRGFGFLNSGQRKALREAVSSAYDAGKAHGVDLASVTLGTPTNNSPINSTRAALELKNGNIR